MISHGLDIEAILKQVKNLPADRRIEYVKAELNKIEDPNERTIAETLILIGLELGPEASRENVIVLVHGIRTSATWQERVRSELQDNHSITVYPIGYEYLDVGSFLFPYLFRKYPTERVLRELRVIASKHNQPHITVVAHSFGTYVLSKILKNHSDVTINRLLLCGSVVPRAFRWDLIPNKPKSIVNDVGTRDIWPILAGMASWGYGPSGTFGFKTNVIRDRFHALAHSEFFSLAHIRTYWLPYLVDGQVVPSAWDSIRPDPPKWMELLSIMPFKTLIGILLFLLVWWLFFP